MCMGCRAGLSVTLAKVQVFVADMQRSLRPQADEYHLQRVERGAMKAGDQGNPQHHRVGLRPGLCVCFELVDAVQKLSQVSSTSKKFANCPEFVAKILIKSVKI